jgi:hypothetical protein
MPRRICEGGVSLPPERRLQAAGAKIRLWDGPAYKGGRQGRQANRRAGQPAGPGRRKNLENPCMADSRQIAQQIRQRFHGGARCAHQTFSKSFLGRIGQNQRLAARKIWIRDSCFAASAPNNGAQEGSSEFGEASRFCFAREAGLCPISRHHFGLTDHEVDGGFLKIGRIAVSRQQLPHFNTHLARTLSFCVQSIETELRMERTSISASKRNCSCAMSALAEPFSASAS